MQYESLRSIHTAIQIWSATPHIGTMTTHEFSDHHEVVAVGSAEVERSSSQAEASATLGHPDEVGRRALHDDGRVLQRHTSTTTNVLLPQR